MKFTDVPVRRCPPLVFVRLLDELREFVVERGSAGGEQVLAFYHRQFWEAASRRYLDSPAARASLYGLLADYFSGALARRYPARGLDDHARPLDPGLPVPQERRAPSPAAVVELPAALLALGRLQQEGGGAPALAAARPAELAAALGSLEATAAAVSAGRLTEWLLSLIEAEAQLADTPHAAAAADWRRWVALSAPQLLSPADVWAEALSAPPASAPARAAEPPEGGRGAADCSGVWRLVAADRPRDWPALLSTLEGHTDEVQCAAWSPDGSRVASACRDKQLRVWHAASGRCLATLEGQHTHWLFWLAWSPDGRLLATASRDKTARVWDAASGRCLLTLNARKALLSAAWSPDGRRLASGSHGHFVAVWDASSGAEVAVLEGHGDEVRGVSWSSDGAWLSSASVDRTVKVWRVDGWAAELTLEGHGAEVNVANWSPDDTRLATASHDCTARVWDVTGAAPPHRCVAVLTHPGVVLDAVWAPSSAGGGSGRQRLATGSQDGLVRLWDVVSGACERELAGHSGYVFSVAWSPADGGARLVTASSDRTVRLWTADGGEGQRRLAGHTMSGTVTMVCPSPDGSRLASTAVDSTVRLWSTAEGTVERVLEGHASWTRDVTWSPDAARLASVSHDASVRVWDAASGACLQVLEGHPTFTMRVRWSADGLLLASMDYDGQLRVWDAASGGWELLRCSDGHAWQSIDAAVAFAGLSPGDGGRERPPPAPTARFSRPERWVEPATALLGLPATHPFRLRLAPSFAPMAAYAQVPASAAAADGGGATRTARLWLLGNGGRALHFWAPLPGGAGGAGAQ